MPLSSRASFPSTLLSTSLAACLVCLATSADATPARRARSAPASTPAPAALAYNEARLRSLLDTDRYREAAPFAQRLLALKQPSAVQRGLIYEWLVASNNLAELDHRLEQQSPHEAVDLLAAGRLALDRKHFNQARMAFERARHEASDTALRVNAMRGLAGIAFQRRDFPTSLLWLEQARDLGAPTPDLLMDFNETLIRLGRTNDAIVAAEAAVRLSPTHIRANYQLGNGYTRLNYTELAQQCGDGFQRAAALTREASDALEAQALDKARDQSLAALKECPGYGRAHAVLSKASEFERMAVDVHRAADEAAFAAAPMPEIPGIDRYVLNWNELTPRIQKRVALSLAPWKAYIPVLAEGGAHHFIKPMWMRLSETPDGGQMRDARIDYDSRLWDDVRGMGGHLTVTGVEDVERSIFHLYNTVLHETSHQVHGVLSVADTREIEALYRKAKQRDAKTGQAFLSRYAGGSVWEYYAEGVNSLNSPRRDAYDFQEIVRERLEQLDPDLKALVERHLARTDVSASLPIAWVNGANHEAEKGAVEPALALLERARAVAPADPRVLATALDLHAMHGDAAAVRELAQQVTEEQPGNGSLRAAAAVALWHTGEPLAPQLMTLQTLESKLKGNERQAVAEATGRFALNLGDGKTALAAYTLMLSAQSDNPEALWGQAQALALLKRWDEAFAVYARVLPLRTGIVTLRLDYARDLLLAGRVEQAAAQIEEASLLRPQDPQLLAMKGWLALAQQQAQQALAFSRDALARGPWCDLALVVQAAAVRQLGQPEAADAVLAPLQKRLAEQPTPHYVYRPETASWDSVQGDSEALRRIMAQLKG